ncbi:hypothetical protein MMPV_001170 [Pyropia vietnamensis]
MVDTPTVLAAAIHRSTVEELERPSGPPSVRFGAVLAAAAVAAAATTTTDPGASGTAARGGRRPARVGDGGEEVESAPSPPPLRAAVWRVEALRRFGAWVAQPATYALPAGEEVARRDAGGRGGGTAHYSSAFWAAAVAEWCAARDGGGEQPDGGEGA